MKAAKKFPDARQLGEAVGTVDQPAWEARYVDARGRLPTAPD